MRVVVRDARRLSPAAQEDLRRRAVAAVEAGFTQAAVSTVLGVSPQAVSRWVNAFARKGNQALRAGKRGRRPGERKALDPRQEARLRRAVIGKYPDQVALPGMVWTRPQVRDLVRRWFGIGLSLVTIGKYLLRPEEVGAARCPEPGGWIVVGVCSCWVWGYAVRALILVRLWANTPWPHQVRAPVRSSRRVRSQPDRRLRWAIRPSHPVRHLTRVRKDRRCSVARRAGPGWPLRGMATVCTPRSWSAVS